jgi:chromosome transmission fidelity protein 1
MSEFINCLTYLNEDGKILFEEDKSNFLKKGMVLKFLMLNANREFDNIVKLSKNVIFAGGTMKPIEEFHILLKTLNPEQITKFEGGHVINKSNILVRIIQNDLETGKQIQFNYENFKTSETFLLKSIISIVKFHQNYLTNFYKNLDINKGKGIVSFIQNYEILEKLKKQFSGNFYHFEEKGKQDTFEQFQKSISDGNITVLFAVIGGKLSEGINFSDDLARCVIVFGLPYPNIKSQDIKLKMKYYDSLYERKESSFKGDDYYENMCMKAVNQSIGRAIRHKNDYASIILVDSRYAREKIQNKLPTWIKASGIKAVGDSVKDYESDLNEFYKLNK